MPNRRRAEMIEDLLRDVPFERLVAAMASVMQMRQQRAGGSEVFELVGIDLVETLDEFLHDCSTRQLRLLRELALALEGGWEH